MGLAYVTGLDCPASVEYFLKKVAHRPYMTLYHSDLVDVSHCLGMRREKR